MIKHENTQTKECLLREQVKESGRVGILTKTNEYCQKQLRSLKKDSKQSRELRTRWRCSCRTYPGAGKKLGAAISTQRRTARHRCCEFKGCLTGEQTQCRVNQREKPSPEALVQLEEARSGIKKLKEQLGNASAFQQAPYKYYIHA